MSSDTIKRIIYYPVQACVFLLLLGIVVITITGFIPLRSTYFNRKAEQLLYEGGVDSCRVASVEITAWKSIKIKNVYLETAFQGVGRFKTTIREIQIEETLFQYILKRRKVREIIGKKGKTSFKSTGNLSESHLRKLFTAGHALLKNRPVRCSGVNCTFGKETKEIVGLKNAELVFSGSGKKNKKVDVTYRIPLMTFHGDGIEEVAGNCGLDTDGILMVEVKKGTYYDGAVEGTGKVNLFAQRVGSYKLTIKNLDFTNWYMLKVGVGSISGNADITVTGNDIPFSDRYMTRKIDARLVNVKMEGLPVQRSLATSLFIPEIKSLQFSTIEVAARTNSGDTVTVELKGDGPDLIFSSNGWQTASGNMQYTMTGTFSKEMIQQFPPVVRKSLVPVAQGGGKFGCRIFGDFNDPRFELDKETLQRAIGSMFNDVKDEFMKLFR